MNPLNKLLSLAWASIGVGACFAIGCGAGEPSDGADGEEIASVSEATFGTLSTDWEAALGWCNHPSGQLHLGDFNGDGRMDMLCHDTATGYKWIAYATPQGAFTGTNWEANLGWCSHPSGELHIGDFNRDGRDDMLCHDNVTGYKWIAYSKPGGTFTGTDWEADLGWCNHPTGELHLGDYNGDGRTDMLCHDTATGYKWIAYSRGSGRFTGTDWEANLGWCNHPTGRLYVGDFSGDRRADMLCHDVQTGYKWVALANASGRFRGTTWEANLGWCNHAGAELHLGDFDGDGREDMMCHDVRTGYKWIALADPGGTFRGTSWEGDMRWCYHPSGDLYIGDFNGDRRSDMLCHDVDSGYKWVSLSDL